MVTKRDVLQFIYAQRAPITVCRLLEGLSLSKRAAELRLARLWDARLIEPTTRRERSSRQALDQINFRLTPQGIARLEYWKSQGGL